MSPHPDGEFCQAMLEDLERFVDGDLPSREMAEFERHLASCDACRAEAQRAAEIRDALRALPHQDAPRRVIEAVKTTAREERASSSRPRWTRLRPSPVWALAAALLLAAVLAPLVFAPSAQDGGAEVAGSATVDPAEVERATEEVRVALAYVGRVTRRTGLEIRDGLIVEGLVVPAAEGLSSLRDAPGSGVRGEGNET